MKPETVPLLVTLALLAGCTVVRVDHEKATGLEDESLGQVRFLALRGENPDRLSNGYVLTLLRNFVVVATIESSSSEAIGVDDLKPGLYDAAISGRGIDPRSAVLEVRAGESTIVRLMIRNARRVAAANETAEVIGKVLLYTAGCVVYATVWLFCEMLTSDDDEDDECPRCHRKSCVCPPVQKKTPESVGRYRKK